MQAEAGIICGSAAVKDLDCPKDGCYGFSFTLPKGFVADDTIASPQKHRPQPEEFPTAPMAKSQPDWTTMFERTTKAPDSASGRHLLLPGPARQPELSDREVNSAKARQPRPAARRRFSPRQIKRLSAEQGVLARAAVAGERPVLLRQSARASRAARWRVGAGAKRMPVQRAAH